MFKAAVSSVRPQYFVLTGGSSSAVDNKSCNSSSLHADERLEATAGSACCQCWAAGAWRCLARRFEDWSHWVVGWAVRRRVGSCRELLLTATGTLMRLHYCDYTAHSTTSCSLAAASTAISCQT